MTKKQALSILKPKDSTEEALKQAFRKAALKYHPDHDGGDENLMKVVNAAYDFLKNVTWTPYEQRAAAKETPVTESLKKQWNKVKHFGKVKGEIIGVWIWLSGETWRYKKQLKKFGFKFSRNKTAWYWHDEQDYQKRNGLKFSMSDIRERYGSQNLDSETQKALAG